MVCPMWKHQNVISFLIHSHSRSSLDDVPCNYIMQVFEVRISEFKSHLCVSFYTSWNKGKNTVPTKNRKECFHFSKFFFTYDCHWQCLAVQSASLLTYGNSIWHNVMWALSHFLLSIAVLDYEYWAHWTI